MSRPDPTMTRRAALGLATRGAVAAAGAAGPPPSPGHRPSKTREMREDDAPKGG